jgi:4-carboxymuconolactone decarboxylase
MMKANMARSAVTADDVNRVSPTLASFTQNAIEENLWKRPDLSPRDRSLVTVSALTARNQTEY